MDAFAHCLEAFSSPFYHPMGQGIALEGMRLALGGASLAGLLPSLIGLTALTAVLLPTGAALFVWAINLAKDDGSLVHY